MEGSNRQNPGYGLPAWKIVTISNNHSRRIDNLYYNNYGRNHRQNILFDETYANKKLNAAKIKQPPVPENQSNWAMESSSDFSATIENDPEHYVARELDHRSTMHDNQLELGLEVKLEMNSDNETAVIFEPCGSEPELEVGPEMEIETLNRIQALEERLMQLESEIQQLKELNQKSKRGIIPLNGDMVAIPCGCKSCSTEP